MDTLVAHPHHYTMPPSAVYPSRDFPSAAASSSVYPSSASSSDPFPSQQPLSISTTHSTPPHDPEEETAHPLRPAPPSLGQDQQELEGGGGGGAEGGQSFADAFPGLSRPLNHQERELLAHLDRLKFFLATAPSRWSTAVPSHPHMQQVPLPLGHPSSTHPALNRFLLPNSEYVSCVLWGGLYHITGTDIVRALVFRFEAFGRPVRNMKKFEEGVFSDLRNLKPGVDACLEEPKSPFLDLLFKYQCIRTQKKQKVFYWFSVPHDRLFLDALERDLKREKMGLEPTTLVTGEPAASFTYDPKRSLYEQFSKAQGGVEGEGELEAAVRRAEEEAGDEDELHEESDSHSRGQHSEGEGEGEGSDSDSGPKRAGKKGGEKKAGAGAALNGPNSAFFSMFSLFEGSPTYKQRRKKVPKARRSPSASDSSLPPHALHPHHPQHPLQQQHHMEEEYMLGYPGMGGEPQVDRYGRDTTRMSAAEMFLAQARGEFGPGTNPDLVATQKERQRRAMAVSAQISSQHPHQQQPLQQQQLQQQLQAGAQMMPEGEVGYPGYVGVGVGVGRGEGRHNTFPMYGGQQQQQQQPPQRSNTQPQFDARFQPSPSPSLLPFDHHRTSPFDHAHAHQRTSPFDPPTHHRTSPFASSADPQVSGWSTTSTTGTTKTKAFVCPLFSCGRMFARMEHLKRHLRTHTLERPFACRKCAKRFARSEGLAQHLRTHTHTGSPSSIEGELEMDFGEDVLGLGLVGGVGGLGVGVGVGGMGEMEMEMGMEMGMCEVEIQGSVCEVQGDEEGLVVPQGPVSSSASSLPSSGLSSSALSSSVPTADTDQDVFFPDSPAQWASLPLSRESVSPAHMTPSSSYSSSHSHHSLHHPAHAHHPQDYMSAVSVSAPSHKAAFDHGSLYPPELSLGGGPASLGSGGVIRRHRSATPSVGVGSASRRWTGGSDTSSTGSSRSYHPYAGAVTQSAESSPMQFSVALESAGSGSSYDGVRRRGGGGHSRSSSAGQGLQEQMQHMLHMESIPVDGGASSSATNTTTTTSTTAPSSSSSSSDPTLSSFTTTTASGADPAAGEYYQVHRTDSPMQFATGGGVGVGVGVYGSVSEVGGVPVAVGDVYGYGEAFYSHPVSM